MTDNDNQKNGGAEPSTKQGSGSTIVGFIFGAALVAGGTHWVRSDHRYPIEVEHDIIKTCVEGSNTNTNSYYYRKKESICICALNETMKDISYKDYGEDHSVFLKRFSVSANGCAKGY